MFLIPEVFISPSRSSIVKIAAVSMVKNEADILELFIRINSRIFDAIYILDHGSTDGTEKIVSALTQQGFQLSYTKLPNLPYAQAEITTNAVHQVASMSQFDFVMPLDADEFICADSDHTFRDMIRQIVSPNGLGLLPWATFCPIKGDYFEAQAPLFENFRQRKVEPEQHYKVILGNEFAKHCSIIMGNHDAMSEMRPPDVRAPIPFPLFHVPVRSADQIIRKAILGSYALELNPNRKPGQGAHWDMLAREIRHSKLSLTDEQLLSVSLAYANSGSAEQYNALLQDGSRIGLPSDKIQFRELCEINLLHSFDAQIRELVDFISKK